MDVKPLLPADDESVAEDSLRPIGIRKSDSIDSLQPISIRKLDRLETTELVSNPCGN